MRKIVAIVLSLAIILTGCGVPAANNEKEDNSPVDAETPSIAESTATPQNNSPSKTEPETSETPSPVTSPVAEVFFTGLDDENLLRYVENSLYSGLIDELSSEDYLVEGVEAIYYPKEYIDALANNSHENVYFGYTASELNLQFQGTKYVFTLGPHGQTIVVPMEKLSDDTYTKMMKDVLIGSGVILICVTVSVVAAPASPAISVILAASATTGTTFALESGAFSFVAATIATAYQTEDISHALKQGAAAAGEGFKWGAISGTAVGGGKAAFALKKATLNGLTMNQAALLQKETQWPLEAITSLHSPAEAEIYKNAKLIPTQLANGEWAFVREIDWRLIDNYGRSQVERIAAGLAPIDETGISFDLHHIGMRADSPLAILKYAEHHAKENYSILHYMEEGKDISASLWNKQRRDFWQKILKTAQAKGLV